MGGWHSVLGAGLWGPGLKGGWDLGWHRCISGLRPGQPGSVPRQRWARPGCQGSSLHVRLGCTADSLS